MSLPDGVEVSMGSVAERSDTPAVWSLSWASTMTSSERPSLSSSVDEERLELALFGVLQEPPALWPLVKRDGARYAVVGVHVRYVQSVEFTVLR